MFDQAQKPSSWSAGKIAKWAIGSVVALLLLSTILGSFYIIDEKERGVVLSNGAFKEVVGPGLQWKIPFIESVAIIDIQSNAAVYQGLQAYTSDQQTATMNVSINWSVDPSRVKELYQRYTNPEGMIAREVTRRVGSELEKTFGQFTAVNAVKERGSLASKFAEAIRSAAGGPLLIESVQIENIDFTDAYEKAIEANMNAEVNERREIVEARIKNLQADTTAYSKLAASEAEAKGIELIGKAQAEAITARAEALKGNQDLVGLTWAEKWDGKLPTTMPPNQTVPFMNTK